MSNQTPDRAHAQGTFVPVVAPPFTGHVLNGKGIRSFIRNSAGNYTVQLDSPLGYNEGHCAARLPANFLGIAGATLAPDGASVLLTCFDLSGAPVDPPTIGLSCPAIEQAAGKGPAPVLPGPPTPPAGDPDYFLGWLHIALNGAVLQDRYGLLGSVAHPATGTYEVTLAAALANPGQAICQVGFAQVGTTATQFVSDTLERHFIYDAAGTLVDYEHFLFIYTSP